MTIDEKWVKVREYYESIYKNKDGTRIKFRKRIDDAEIERLFKAMNQLSLDRDNLPDARQKKFANVIRLLRDQDLGNVN